MFRGGDPKESLSRVLKILRSYQTVSHEIFCRYLSSMGSGLGPWFWLNLKSMVKTGPELKPKLIL